MKDISEKIRQLRFALGYSQEFVATKLKITQQAYSNIESNPQKVSLERLYQLAEILKVNICDLIGEDRNFNQTNINQHGGKAATQMIIHENSERESALSKKFDDLQEQMKTLQELFAKSIDK